MGGRIAHLARCWVREHSCEMRRGRDGSVAKWRGLLSEQSQSSAADSRSRMRPAYSRSLTTAPLRRSSPLEGAVRFEDAER
jgi:hypothetical protein